MSATAMRTHRCGALRLAHAGEEVRLGGWIHRRRDLGGIVFLDLRDRDGLVQVAFGADWTPAQAMAAVGDVDRDGRADIVWRYEGAGANQGLVYVWTMNGPTIGEAAPLLQVSDLNWRIVGIGDFDGDGFSDLFWWHQTTGQTYVWLLGPNTGQIGIKTSGSPFTLTNLNWRVAGVGDYNGDGRADIVWRNIATGLNAIWMMNGVSIL